ncbi:AfsR/SARP family transcriptional regulator [Streptomyces sp. NPDC037389]|uniref:AfsR/SARP family transcriptional regulator n=1 Tax=Streptomyces sp. NPDC037389 TaxID=3155369 RepID=UPI0033E6A81D
MTGMDGGELRFAVLGRMRAWRGDTALELGSPQQQTFLAELLLREGRTASAAEIVDALWGEEVPPRAVGTVRTYASRLRRLLEPGRAPGAASRVLVSVSGGYALRVPREALDAARFQDRLAAAARARATGLPHEARELLRSALALWSDEPLLGLSGPCVPSRRAHLSDQRLMAFEARLELDLELGDPDAALRELADLAARHPLHERLSALRILALHQGGRRADALAVYEETRRVLAERMGLEPGRELTEARRRLLVADTDAGDDTCPHHAHEPVRPAQLPGDLADFTGRAAAVEEVCAALVPDGPRGEVTVVVSGPGGVGKSVLAVHAAHRVREHFPDGQLYADLRGPDGRPAHPATVLGTFLRALGVATAAVPDGEAERAALLRRLLADRRVLMVLDNAEDTGQARPFLPAAPACAVLVTSRAKPAGLPHARLTDLGALTPEEARALLARVAGEDRVAAEPRAAAELVEACGLLPVAVRIAAARLAARPSWTLDALLERLADDARRLAELRTAGMSAEAALAPAYDRLDAGRRRSLALLALAEGTGFSSHTAAALLGVPEDEAETLCESLVDASLLQSPAPGRYGFHCLFRLLVRERAGTALPPAERAAALRRLLESAVARAREVTAPGASGDRFLAEAPALLAVTEAAADADTDTDGVALAVDLLRALEGLLVYGVHERELERAALEVAGAALGLADGRGAGRAYAVLARVHANADRFEALAEACREALALSRAAEDAPTTADCLVLLSRYALRNGCPGEAYEALAEARAVYRACGDRSGEADVAGALAEAHLALGRTDHALAAAELCVAVHRRRGTGHPVAAGLYRLGRVLASAGRAEEAAGRYVEALDLFRGHGNRLWEGRALLRLAEVLPDTGRDAVAVIHAELAVAALEEAGDADGRSAAQTALDRVLEGFRDAGRAEALIP